MRIAIVVNGSRGDVQPMVALAQKLQEHGHEAWPPWAAMGTMVQPGMGTQG